jgi:hypothetical protein
MEQLAEHILRNNQSDNKHMIYDFPIVIKTKINDTAELINANFVIHLNFDTTTKATFFITDRVLHNRDGTLIKLYNIRNEHPEFDMKTPKGLASYMEWCYNKIDDLAFDNDEGRFVDKGDIIVKQLSKIAFNVEEKKYSIGTECCVCLNDCQTKFCCNHHICYCCASKLKVKKCPICRHTCATFIYDDLVGDDSDSDSE